MHTSKLGGLIRGRWLIDGQDVEIQAKPFSLLNREGIENRKDRRFYTNAATWRSRESVYVMRSREYGRSLLD